MVASTLSSIRALVFLLLLCLVTISPLHARSDSTPLTINILLSQPSLDPLFPLLESIQGPFAERNIALNLNIQPALQDVPPSPPETARLTLYIDESAWRVIADTPSHLTASDLLFTNHPEGLPLPSAPHQQLLARNLLVGAGLYATQSYSLALRYFNIAADTPFEEDVHTPRALHFYIANAELEAGNTGAAITHYQQSLAYTPVNTLIDHHAAFNLGWLYLQQGETDLALQPITNLIQSNIAASDQPANHHISLLRSRSTLYALALQYDPAIQDLNHALEIARTASADFAPAALADLYLQRGQTYLLLYEWDQVLNNYNTALELDPSRADLYYYRGILYYSILQTGQSLYAEALSDFQTYLDRAPDGSHAAEAARLIADIQRQQEALDG